MEPLDAYERLVGRLWQLPDAPGRFGSASGEPSVAFGSIQTLQPHPDASASSEAAGRRCGRYRELHSVDFVALERRYREPSDALDARDGTRRLFGGPQVSLGGHVSDFTIYGLHCLADKARWIMVEPLTHADLMH